jgi:type II restriction enzyme
MDAKDSAARIRELAAALGGLSTYQLEWLEGVVNQFKLKPDLWREPKSELVTDCVSEMFGDALQIHHCFSREPLSKDRFEYAFERVLSRCGIPAQLASRGNPGHDITIAGERFSLKTQADRSIKEDFLHISKFMELGKGRWNKAEKDLVGLRDQVFKHMNGYDRILQLRRITDTATLQKYELVEIPKDLLLKAKDGTLRMMHGSAQRPKPGTCTVAAKDRRLFELYFDGGTERKLQIRYLDKRDCQVHASWGIKRIPATIVEKTT